MSRLWNDDSVGRLRVRSFLCMLENQRAVHTSSFSGSLTLDVGELIVITSPALQTPKKWPGFMERARQEAVSPTITFKKFDGSVIGSFPMGLSEDPSLPIYRSKLHNVLFEYAEQLGIPIEFSAGVSEFFETDDHGGVVLSDGRRLEADVVVAADGVGSKSWALVVGSNDPPISSGFVLYRVTFPVA